MTAEQAELRPFRFTKSFRIRKEKEFDRVFQEGKRVSGGSMMLICAPNGLDHSRFGILAGRKIGKAVTRNRVKRLFREAFRLSRARLPSGFDFVVVLRRTKKEWTLTGVTDGLKELARKAGGSEEC